MNATVLAQADVASVESWLASPEAETAAEMDLLAEVLNTNSFFGGASW